MLFDGRELVVQQSRASADPSRRRSVRWVAGFFVVMFALAAFLSPNPISARISDQVSAWVDPPGPQIERLATDAGLTDAARAVFFASKPRLESREQLASTCFDDSSEVLGCYTSGDRVIHVMEVVDPSHGGLEAGVAAHETLHAVWNRMSDAERTELGAALRTEWARLSHDAAFAARMTAYADLDEAGFTNELHSVLGTEVLDVGIELESHYADYFLDRQTLATRTVAAFSD